MFVVNQKSTKCELVEQASMSCVLTEESLRKCRDIAEEECKYLPRQTESAKMKIYDEVFEKHYEESEKECVISINGSEFARYGLEKGEEVFNKLLDAIESEEKIFKFPSRYGTINEKENKK